MPPKNRSTRIRKLAVGLSERFALDYGKREWIEAAYDDRHAQWTLSWTDGPTAAQVTRAARAADKEVTDGLHYERHYSQRAYALGAIHWALTGEELQGGTDWWAASRVEERLAKAKTPGRPKPGRETDMVERLIEAADNGRGRNFAGGQEICGLVNKRGLSWLLTPAGQPADWLPLTPLELLTTRYAQGEQQQAWWNNLTPLTALEAFAAVQADPQAPGEAIDAALALVPDLHTAIDDAAADLRTRASTST
ncbi:hypothetical protein ACFVHW_04185 [Streptomyces sp. NPDC127110]|uniref:hypothetical protein n=1 Tax=Streptomyces sp. NPDC127110 TaxID=3345362 RepID=UPI00362D2157